MSINRTFILVTFSGETEHFSGNKWSIKVEKLSGGIKAQCTKAHLSE